MDDEEIARLIKDLRAMLVQNGFAWAVAEAEDQLFPGVSPRTRAFALIGAAQAVTVDVAQVEIAALDGLGVEDLDFKPDEDDGLADADGASTERRAAIEEGHVRLRGPERRSMLASLVEQRSAFDALRRSLDGER